MKKLIYSSGAIISGFIPMVVLAQPVDTDAGGGFLDTIAQLIVDFGAIVNTLIPIVIALAVLAFFWGLAKYVFAQGDETKKADGKKIMVWGGIALFVIFSIWGIISTVQSSFGIDESNRGALDSGDLVPTNSLAE